MMLEMLCIVSAPNCSTTRLTSTPQFRRNPRQKVSSNACSAEIALHSLGAEHRYLSSESGLENRIALLPLRTRSMECASTPKPRYGWRVQYFRLCFDSRLSRAKLEISYCLI